MTARINSRDRDFGKDISPKRSILPTNTPSNQASTSRRAEPTPAPFPMAKRAKPEPPQPAPFPLDIKSRSTADPIKRTTRASSQKSSQESDRRESFGLGPGISPLRPEQRRKSLQPFPMATPEATKRKSNLKRQADEDSPESDRLSKRSKPSPPDDSDRSVLLLFFLAPSLCVVALPNV